VQKFVASFKAKYGKLPDGAAALGYDAVNLLAHGMRTAKSTVPAKVADALRATRDWQGVTGGFTYDENGEVVGKRIIKLVVANGKFEFLKEDRTTAQAAR
jgi:branched-chain amino acid transport system substrate-binding protein